ncbi:uncharacterized protein LOC130719424 [Lotus japonicus]|uniref:uncharacterized protein LOC130719424 n=1 Tax=Lotus japonicus TaxID=34305 RepID=UPI0025862E8A|nr:uncharacterized protein LOC130719424 [Lotus japonicus]
MKTLFWNCHGLGNRRTVRALKELCKIQDPTCLFLMERKRKDHEMNRWQGLAGMTNIISVSCEGDGCRRAGGVAFLWKNDVNVSLLSHSLNHMDFIISLKDGSLSWRATGIYGYPEQNRKRLTWDLLRTLAGFHAQPAWMVFGDFNLTLSEAEKFGGAAPTLGLQEMFREVVQSCNLKDMGFEGHKYTWRNNQEGEDLIMARLDRCFVTPTWADLFPQAKALHLSFFASDHLPILIDTCPRRSIRGRGGRVLRFEECWLRDEECPTMLTELWNRGATDPYDRVNSCLVGLKRWAKRRFGNVPMEIKDTKEKLQELQEHIHEDGVLANIKNLEDRLDDLLESSPMAVEEICDVVRNRVSEAMFGVLDGDYTQKDVYEALNQMKPTAAPGPDG